VHGSLASATAGCREHDLAFSQAGVRSFIITFDVYVILNVLRNMIIKDLTAYVILDV